MAAVTADQLSSIRATNEIVEETVAITTSNTVYLGTLAVFLNTGRISNATAAASRTCSPDGDAAIGRPRQHPPIRAGRQALRWHLHNGWSWPPQRMCLGGADKAVQRLAALERGAGHGSSGMKTQKLKLKHRQGKMTFL